MKWVNYPFKMEKQYRREGWDYSKNGYYFITICTKDRLNYFGEIVDNEMYVSEIGSIVDKFWSEIPIHFPDIEIDRYIVMPNHFHGILVVNKINNIVGTHYNAFLPTEIKNNLDSRQPNIKDKYKNLANKSTQTIPLAIKLFKRSVKQYANQNNIKFEWQSRFHDRIIRSEKEYWAKRIYIENNPKNWEQDIEHIGRNAL
jgi:REP element-mobilizing transposase RayT